MTKFNTANILKSGTLACAVTCLFLASSAGAATKLQEALQHYQAHRFKEAVAAFDQHLSTNSKDVAALYYDALCNQQLGDMARAKGLYRQVVQASPTSQYAKYAESILVKVDPNYHPVTANGGTSETEQAPAATSATPKSSAAANRIIGPDSGDVYYKLSGKRMMVPVEINGHTVEMLMDTGAPGVCIGKGELEAANVRAPAGDPTGQAGGSSNNSTVGSWRMKCSLKVGPFTDPNCSLEVLDAENGNALLGQGFMRYFEYQVDQSAHRIHFVKKGTSAAVLQSGGYELPFIFRERGRRIIVEGEINGRKNKFMMDTGNSGSGIAFHSKEQAVRYGVTIPEDAGVGTFSGVSGSGSAYTFRINHLRIGPIDCIDLPVAVHMNADFGGEEPLLGQDALAGWQYRVDYEKKVLHLLRR